MKSPKQEITLKINGHEIHTPAGSSILEAAQSAGIYIPTLCFLKDTNEIGACRICVVEVVGSKSLMPACVTRAASGMEVRTDTPAVLESRRMTLELMCSDHNMSCTECVRGSDCELRDLCKMYEVDDHRFGEGERVPLLDGSSLHLLRDNAKCILCRRCMNTCRAVQGIGAISANNRGSETNIGFGLKNADTLCVNCGQCIQSCPTGALSVHDDTQEVWKAFADRKKHVVAVVSPYVGAMLGESFGEPVGTDTAGKAVTMLRRLGFDRVFALPSPPVRGMDHEKKPVLSSSCPAWVKYCETYYPELKGNLSSAPGPAQAFGALCKSRYTEAEGIKTEDMFTVSISPCTAEKFERTRGENLGNIDAVITVPELAVMFRRACVSSFTTLQVWREMPDGDYDDFPFGEAGPAAELPDSTAMRILLVSGLANAKKVLEEVKAGETDYDYIEIMACPGGCLNGGGAPRKPGPARNFSNIAAGRAQAMTVADFFCPVTARRS